MICINLLLPLLLGASPDDTDLLLHYRFDTQVSDTVVDRSGHDHNGKIIGAVAWVEEAIKLNGSDTYIEVPASAKFDDAGNRITLEIWCKPTNIQGGMIGWFTGSSWIDARLALSFIAWSHSRLIGVCSDGEAGIHKVRHAVKHGRWMHLALRLNGETITIFADGRALNSVPSRLKPNLRDVAMHIGKSNGLGDPPFFDGLISEVRIRGRAMDDSELLTQYLDGCRQRGIQPALYPLMTHAYDPNAAALNVKLVLRRYVDPPPGAVVTVELLDEAEIPVHQDRLELATTVNHQLPTHVLAAGIYTLRAAVVDANGGVIGKAATATWRKSALAAIARGGEQRMLNNMVFELVNRAVQPGTTVTFDNPRDGWVYVSLAGGRGQLGNATIAGESMRLLPAGEHTLKGDGRSEAQLIVRLVPSMMYCAYPARPLAGYSDYDWAYLNRYVLPHINTIVGNGDPAYHHEQREWQRRGGQWFLEQDLPTFIDPPGMPQPLTGEFVEKYWTESSGFTNPYLDGVLADEFVADNSPNFHGYMDGVKRIANNPRYQGRAVHCWCTSIYAEPLGLDFARTVVDHGWKLAWEVYLPERPSQAAAKDCLDQRIRREMARWDQAIPGIAEQMIFVLGILCAPPESCNLNPNVDYKVFLDMQFQWLATAPECFGQWGVMVYKSRYAEEEAVRWSAKLFRHYCIEGNTQPLYAKYGFRYELTHVLNADFDDGLQHWTADGEVTTGRMPGLGVMLNRYGDFGYGDAYALMTRRTDGPNRLTQTIKNLTPGRPYSVKAVVVELQDIEQGRTNERRLGASVKIRGGEVLPERSFVSNARALHKAGRWAALSLPYQNHHFHVFRATDQTATIELIDWVDEQAPGGPVGEQLLFNFVEVQPWLEP